MSIPRLLDQGGIKWFEISLNLLVMRTLSTGSEFNV